MKLDVFHWNIRKLFENTFTKLIAISPIAFPTYMKFKLNKSLLRCFKYFPSINIALAN